MIAGGLNNSISVLSCCTSAATGIEVCSSVKQKVNLMNLADTIITFTELKITQGAQWGPAAKDL